jgi:hypothetical protein
MLLLTVSAIKLLAEIALMALAGQFVPVTNPLLRGCEIANG